MTPDQEALWQKVKFFTIDDPLAEFSFTDRLARENRWSMEFAHRIVWEYKKFIFLICIADHPLTPSDQVDQAWHLHLIYTESYWTDWCEHTLNRKIHHGPTKGGGMERTKYKNWYEETKLFYTQTFKMTPPIDIWPSSEVRFKEINFSRVNLDKYWTIPKLNLFKKWKF